MDQVFSSSDSLPDPSFLATPSPLGFPRHPSGSAPDSALHPTHLFLPHLHHPTAPTQAPQAMPPPLHCSRSLSHQQVSVPAQPCTEHSGSRGRQTRPVLQELHRGGNPGQSQSQQSPRTLVVLTGMWSNPAGSLVLSQAFLIILRPYSWH